MQITGILTLGLITLISTRAAAQEPGSADPFAHLRKSIEGQLSTILQKREAFVKPSVLAPTMQDRQAVVALVQERAPAHEQVSFFARQFWGGRSTHLASALARLQLIRPALEGILESEGVPKDLIAVVLVESGARSDALSPRQALGLWQFIPETARQYGLQVGPHRDERVHIERATRAAARYLHDLYRRFGDWPLALAAYNAGQDTVEKALVRSRATTFWQLRANGRLPSETRDYVPAVLGAMKLLDSEEPSGTPQPRTVKWIYAPMEPTK